ncbi:MAG: aldo/keto reductase [Planctomycetaceae bacterium]|nr:aldo/keto reductase [Planctomycetaceae bacterium]
MKKMTLGRSDLKVPPLAIGCMRMDGLDTGAAAKFIGECLDAGANFFDHADIYGDGRCEEIFAKAVGMDSTKRQSLFLQSKCGIVKGKMFDFSRDHILASVDGILDRLKTEYLDVLLLHRPDALVEPEEVAEAFDTLERNGKVRHFGVSNQKPMQIRLLKKHVRQPLIVNQLQLSIPYAGMIANGIHVNMAEDAAIDRDGSVLDYCRLEDITIQAWSPFQYGFFEGVFLGSPKFPELNKAVDALAKKYDVANTTIAVAWILRHPAKIQPVTGTMNAGRMRDCVKAADICLSREEWYSLYLAAGYTLP